jgi:hypothetical protein
MSLTLIPVVAGAAAQPVRQINTAAIDRRKDTARFKHSDLMCSGNWLINFICLFVKICLVALKASDQVALTLFILNFGYLGLVRST